MFRDMRPRSRALIAATTLGLIAAPLTFAQTATANPAGDGLVISEAYLNGGSASATYTNKYVEIYNPTASDIALTGMSLQYRPPANTGNASNTVALSGTVPAGGYFVFQGGSNGANGSAVPDVDQASTAINPGAGGGTLFIADGSTAVVNPTTPPVGTTIVDRIGWGTSNAPEGTAASTASVTTSLQRQTVETVVNKDTDNNSADFVTSAGTPGAVYVPPAPPEEFQGTIAQIQGAGAESPHAGDIATTRGVVTAAYPTGGLSGFYLQTPGTGGARDLSAASDGIFVFVPGGSLPAAATNGNYVEVVGEVSEFNGLTEITADSVTDVDEAVTAPTASTTTGWPTSDAQRESLEGMLYRPTGDFTVSNTFSTNQFGEIGLASGTKPLIQRTEVERPGPAGSSAVEADNAARRVALDDGSSTNFLASSSSSTVCGTRPTPCLVNGDQTPSYVSTTKPVIVGAAVDFTDDVVVDWRNSAWKFQPTTTVVGPGNANAPATFENSRTAAPEASLINKNGTADIKVASFNVLNYFTTLGTDGGTCVPFTDRTGDGSTVSGGCDQRGAWDSADFAKQQEKIVSAINALDADVVGLMEIENSAALGETPDEALNSLVAALNADAGAGTWAANPSSTELPAGGGQDVITNAIIYQPATVDRVGESRALGTLSDAGEAFSNAREPLGQVFVSDAGGDPFLFVVNHFKSKGSAGPNPGDTDTNDGQGASNGSRVLQAAALRDWVNDVKGDTESVLLAGDFNSYTEEDPLHVLYDAGYADVEKEFANGEYSYSFSGLSGSLDHILANEAAMTRATGTDIWGINSGESLALEYSRWNYHATDFHAPGPYRSSDHDPVVLGLKSGAVDPNAPVDVQILGTNDFHGRILNNTNNEAGAAVLSGAVKQFRSENPNTVFAAAGDLIGASTFESFIQKDKPTIDVLNEAGLEVSAAGNHEFDQGYDDLVNRVMKPYDATNNEFGGAEWQYIAANVRKKADDSHALPDRWMKTVGGVQVGFVGAVTEDLPSLVSPDGIADIAVTDIVEETNASAEQLKEEGADVIVLLVHEGAANTSYGAATDPDSAFGQIVNGVNADIDAIVSGHTHLAYNHSVPVPAWVTEGRAVTERPVVSAGQYGSFLDKIVFTVDPVTGDVLAKTQETVALESCGATCAASSPTWTANFPADPAIKPIVDDAVAKAAVLGAQVLGKIDGPFNRAKLANGTTENRGGESTLGNLVAEVQRWATESETAGSAEIAFMNPGGLRADMTGTGTGAFPRDLTYRDAALVQPFANTLVNLKMTGTQIEKVLEQQWQRDANNSIPSRPFLRLGTSKNFEFTYDPSLPEGSRITGMWLNGTALVPSQVYSVTANSFLASGGDNFWEFGNVTNKRDTGKSDLTAMVDYMAEFADTTPLPVDYKQHAIGVKFPAGAPASYKSGDHVLFDLSSLAFSTAADQKDTQVKVSLGADDLGTFPVDNTIGTAVFDEYGTASVDVVLPAGTPGGSAELTVTGLTTGTTFPVTVPTEKTGTTITAEADDMTYGTDGSVAVDVDPDAARGEVTVKKGDTLVATGTLGDEGKAVIVLPGDSLPVGTNILTVEYAGNGSFNGSTTTVTIEVASASPTITAVATPSTVKVKKGTSKIAVTVAADGFTPEGFVAAYLDGEYLTAAPLTGGKASLTVGPFDTVGAKAIEVRYLATPTNEGASTTVTVSVQKAKPKVKVTGPKTAKVGKTRPKVTVTVSADGIKATGSVVFRVDGHKVATRSLSGGKASFKLNRFFKTGRHPVEVTYQGSSLLESGQDTHVIRAVR